MPREGSYQNLIQMLLVIQNFLISTYTNLAIAKTTINIYVKMLDKCVRPVDKKVYSALQENEPIYMWILFSCDKYS